MRDFASWNCTQHTVICCTHSFPPLTNHREDVYGGDFDGRSRFLLETVEAVRDVWPKNLPLFVRLSVTDWTEGGWRTADSIRVARRLSSRGVDAIDCSSGGIVLHLSSFRSRCKRDKYTSFLKILCTATRCAVPPLRGGFPEVHALHLGLFHKRHTWRFLRIHQFMIFRILQGMARCIVVPILGSKGLLSSVSILMLDSSHPYRP